MRCITRERQASGERIAPEKKRALCLSNFRQSSQHQAELVTKSGKPIHRPALKSRKVQVSRTPLTGAGVLRVPKITGHAKCPGLAISLRAHHDGPFTKISGIPGFDIAKNNAPNRRTPLIISGAPLLVRTVM